jgi:hypothetical protein
MYHNFVATTFLWTLAVVIATPVGVCIQLALIA